MRKLSYKMAPRKPNEEDNNLTRMMRWEEEQGMKLSELTEAEWIGRDKPHTADNQAGSKRLPDTPESKQDVNRPKRNTKNNRGERGKDYAPKSVDARIKANIDALVLAKELRENGQSATQKQMEVLAQV